MSKGKTFRPPGGDIGQRDRVEAATLQSPSTVGHQIDLQKARFGLVPLCEGPDRDLLFEQGTRFGGRKAMGMGVTMGLQEAICGSRAHREQLAAVFLAELDMPMLLQRFDDAWQKRHQAFGTNPVEGLPGQHQCLFDLRPIPAAECCRRRKTSSTMVEQPEGIFARVPGGAHKFLQDLLLLGPRRSVICRRNLLEQDPPGLRPQSFSHVFLLICQATEIACDSSPSACLTTLVLLSVSIALE